MKLPNGVNQETACILIAIREMLDNPEWEHPYLVNNLRENNRGIGNIKGFTGNIAKLAQLSGLYSGPITIYARSFNSDVVHFSSLDNELNWYLERQDKIVVVFKVGRWKSHAECIPATLITSLFQRKLNITHIILPGYVNGVE